MNREAKQRIECLQSRINRLNDEYCSSLFDPERRLYILKEIDEIIREQDELIQKGW